MAHAESCGVQQEGQTPEAREKRTEWHYANGGRNMQTLCKNMGILRAGLAAAATLMVFGCSSDNSSSGRSCQTDAECDTFTVCIDGTCGEKPCSGLLDCAPGQLCLPKTGSTETVCTAPECNDEEPCPNNGICNNGICEGGVFESHTPAPPVVVVLHGGRILHCMLDHQSAQAIVVAKGFIVAAAAFVIFAMWATRLPTP